MIMQYQYRWLYAVILSTILQFFGFFYLINPQWLQIVSLKREINNHEQILSLMHDEKKQPKMLMKPFIILSQSQPEFIFDLISVANMKGLNLSSLHLLSSKDPYGLFVHLILLGSYSQFIDFVDSFEDSRYPVTILDFNYKSTKNNQAEFAMDISIIKTNIERHVLTHIDVTKTYNPFCISGGGFVEQIDNINLQTVSLSQLKMVGYFEQDHTAFALLALPNNRIKDIKLGAIIGREQGVAMHISKDKIDVRMPDGGLRNIKMQL